MNFAQTFGRPSSGVPFSSALPASQTPPSPARKPLWVPAAINDVLATLTHLLAHEFGSTLCAITLAEDCVESVRAYVYGRTMKIVVPSIEGANTLPSLLPLNTLVRQVENDRSTPLRASLEVPLFAGAHRLGSLWLYASKGTAFDWVSETHRRIVGKLAGTALAEAKRHEQTQQLAFVDALTGFFSRNYYFLRLEEAIAAARRYNEPLSVVAYDFDRLKYANELHGYPIGSRMMFEASGVVRDCLRQSDLPARLMGDEYGVILPRTNLSGAFHLAETIQATVGRLEIHVCAEDSLSGREGSFLAGIAVGVAVLEPDEDAEKLTERALKAVQQNKQERRAQQNIHRGR